ncbi:MAG: ATPase domain-containing protein [Vicinamibacteria bacterium]
MEKMAAVEFPKSPSGIEGLDCLMRGGFPQGRATLLAGGPGAGKTVLALRNRP